MWSDSMLLKGYKVGIQKAFNVASLRVWSGYHGSRVEDGSLGTTSASVRVGSLSTAAGRRLVTRKPRPQEVGLPRRGPDCDTCLQSHGC